MNKPTELPTPVTGKQKMTPSEAFVETLVAHGVKDVFGIVGSAYMDALDLFPLAGIRFISVAHEQGGGHMADGYSRVSGRHGVCIAQNGPGITNFVTSTAAAFWAHSPVVVITPETGSGTLGLGGFQETEQLPIFSKITKYQAHVNNRARMAELTSRAFDRAHLELGPTQLNIPRDFFYGDIECEIPAPDRDRARCGRRAEPRRGRRTAGGRQVPGDPLRRRRRDGRRAARSRAARRAPAGARGLELSPQRFVSGEASVVGRTARLPGKQGGDDADRQGRRRAGARHAPRSVRHAAAVRDRVLAEGREDHPGRRRREDAGARQADLRRHLRRCAGGGAGARRTPVGQGARLHREQGRAPRRTSPRRRRRGKPSSTAGRTRRTRGRSRCRRTRPTCIRGRCCASSKRRCPKARWCRPTSATSARCRTRTFASTGRARCSRR